MSHIDEFGVFIDDYRPDIICINETKIDDKIHDSDTEIDNYLLVRKDRNSDGGGVAIYILKDLEFAVRDDLMTYNLEMLPFNLRLGIIGLLLSLHFTDLLISLWSTLMS